MNERMRHFAWLNVIGGAAVLASYAWGIARLGDDAALAWGGVPDSLRPWYVRSMLLAAAGYFPMTVFVWNVLRRSKDGAFPQSVLPHAATALYAVILVGSAVWLPLTCRMLEQPSMPLWWLIRADLALVGVCSVAVLGLIIRDRSGTRPLGRLAAAFGAVAFCIQTALLDAIVWPAYFFP